MSVEAIVEWDPRTDHYEADELPAERIDFKASELQWEILSGLPRATKGSFKLATMPKKLA